MCPKKYTLYFLILSLILLLLLLQILILASIFHANRCVDFRMI